jgi:spore maturation protein CgeB
MDINIKSYAKKKIMKILIIDGTKKESSLGRIYSGVFRNLGYNVCEFYDLDEMHKQSPFFNYQIFRNINWWRLQIKNRLPILQRSIVGLFKKNMEKMEDMSNKNMLNICMEFNPDILFVVAGRTIRKDTLIEIKQKVNCLCLTYNGDSYENLYSTSVNMIESLQVYDIVFTWSHGLVESVYKLGAKRVEYLPFAFDEIIHQLVKISSDDILKYGHEIVFIGTWDKEREKWLSSLIDFDLGIWGPGWNKVAVNSKLKKHIVKSDKISADEMSKIYQTSKICLNIMRSQNSESHNMKSFEIPALGGFMMTNRSHEHLKFFREGHEIACFEDVAELKSQVLKYLANDEIRSKMLLRARVNVKKKHTYKDRVKEMLRYVEKMP